MGLVTFVSHRAEIESEVQAANARALEIMGGKAETYAKKQCPVDTGNLRNSITHAQVDENTEAIGTNVEYGPYVELGTYKMAAQPFLRPAAEEHGTEYKMIWQRELAKIGK